VVAQANGRQVKAQAAITGAAVRAQAAQRARGIADARVEKARICCRSSVSAAAERTRERRTNGKKRAGLLRVATGGGRGAHAVSTGAGGRRRRLDSRLCAGLWH